MKRFKTVVTTILLIALPVWLCCYKYTGSAGIVPEINQKEEKVDFVDESIEVVDKKIVIEECNMPNLETEDKTGAVEYTSMEVPDIDSSFKTWMSYKTVTSVSSNQYKYINMYGWADDNGFMRSSADICYGIEQDYYLIALGSYYGTEIGTKYRITLDTGNVFYGVLADCKDDRHTDITNRYVVEFLVDISALNKTVKVMGSANYLEPLKGNVIKIEKMKFIEI